MLSLISFDTPIINNSNTFDMDTKFKLEKS